MTRSTISVLYLGIILNIIVHYSKGSVLPYSANYNLFASDLFSNLVDKKSTENLVFSPISIQTSLTLAFAGAGDKTAEEFRKVLHLGEDEKTHITQNFGEFLKSLLKTNENEEISKPQFKIANRIYAAEQHKIKNDFRKIAQENFQADALNIAMHNKTLVLNEINKFIAENTDNKIPEFIKPNDVYDLEAMAIVNAIYYKAQWLQPFNELYTKDLKFYINTNTEKEIPFMLQTSTFNYIDLPELQAQALELPYNNSDISMLIILPNELEGLQKLETKLKNLDLNDISSKMSLQHINVYLPKFRLEYGVSLKDTLQKMGLISMFSYSVNFKDIFESTVPIIGTDVIHKTYLDVDEFGSESTSGSRQIIEHIPLSSQPLKDFRADHPFVFAIRSKSALYFAGHVTKF